LLDVINVFEHNPSGIVNNGYSIHINITVISNSLTIYVLALSSKSVDYPYIHFGDCDINTK